MPDFLASMPFWLVFAFLYVGATLRGQGVYWLGRLVSDRGLRRVHARWAHRADDWLQGEGTARGVETVRRWGLLAVPFAYLTVGFQSMILAGTGILRIGWLRFSLAQIPGALAWAAIYSTIGFAVWEAALAAAAGSPWGLAGILAITVVAVATYVMHRRRTRRPGPEPLLLNPVDERPPATTDPAADTATGTAPRP